MKQNVKQKPAELSDFNDYDAIYHSSGVAHVMVFSTTLSDHLIIDDLKTRSAH